MSALVKPALANALIRLSRETGPHGNVLSVRHLAILSLIQANPDVSVKPIAEAIQREKGQYTAPMGRVSQACAEFVQRGYITKTRDDTDGRLVKFRITPKGAQILRILETWG